MRYINRIIFLAAVALLVLQEHANAQAPPPLRQPSYSPYLNLTRPGNVANNYYGLVRPELEFRNSVNNLQQQYNNLNQPANNLNSVEAPFPGTGHATSFMNLSHYYGNRGRTTGGGQPQSGQGAVAPPRRR